MLNSSLTSVCCFPYRLYAVEKIYVMSSKSTHGKGKLESFYPTMKIKSQNFLQVDIEAAKTDQDIQVEEKANNMSMLLHH